MHLSGWGQFELSPTSCHSNQLILALTVTKTELENREGKVEGDGVFLGTVLSSRVGIHVCSAH